MYQCNNLESTINTLPNTENFLLVSNPEDHFIAMPDGAIRKIVFKLTASLSLISHYQRYENYTKPAYDQYRQNLDAGGESEYGYFCVWLYRKGTTLYQKWDGRNTAFDFESLNGKSFSVLSAWEVSSGEVSPLTVTIPATTNVALKIGSAEFTDTSVFALNAAENKVYLNATGFDANAGSGSIDNDLGFGRTVADVAGTFEVSLLGVVLEIIAY